MTALFDNITHLRATHDPAALQAYEAEKRKASNEKAQEAYLEAIGNAQHHSRRSGKEAVELCWCECRWVRERATRSYRKIWINAVHDSESVVK